MRITNRLNLPEPFVAAATSDHEYAEGRYSVTDLLGGTCEAILKRRHADEIEDDVADRVWAIFGSAVHHILQDAQEAPEQLKENWLCVPIDITIDGNCDHDGKPTEPYKVTRRYELSGIFDLYDDATGTVTDYKTASVWKVQMGDFDDWRKQALMYCWLLQQIGFDAWTGRIVALLKDHSIRKSRTEKGYPKHPVVTLEWRFSNADIEQIEDEIYRWFVIVAAQSNLADDDLTPCDEQQRWHKPDKWAVMKAGRKRALRVYESAAEAQSRAYKENGNSWDGPYHVEFREGEDTKCESYCSVAEFCPYVRRMREAAAAADAPTLALAT
jgi:hypothetical protein